MGSFEWMEVETLSGEIAALETRITQARSRHNYGLVKVLKEEIAAAQQRRARYLANITNSLAASLDSSGQPEAKEAAEPSSPRGGRKEAAEPEPASAKPVAAKEAVVEEEPPIEAVNVVTEEEAAEPEPVEAVAADADAEVAEEEPASEQPVAEAEPETPEEIAEEEPPSAEVVAAAAQDAPEEIAEAEVLGDLPEEAVVEELQATVAKPSRQSAKAAEPVSEAAEPEPVEAAAAPSAEAAEDVTPRRAVSPVADAIKGVSAVWDQLTATDIERAKRELDVRRAEMLARHAEELRGLEADQVEIDTLAQAIDSFLRKFNQPAAENSVVRLDEKRDLRQGNG